ncbi:DUF3703 domain-containing protein [Nocardia sputi]|uniref:DUF3703 domain-containing protein n=1 Tax=Nocardia sputi TaxID=2943705 RepID=UPI0035570727
MPLTTKKCGPPVDHHPTRAHLELARIPSQDRWLHTRNHVAIFALTVGQHDRREAFGQVVRVIVAAAGSLTGRYQRETPAVPASEFASPFRPT